MRSGQGHAKEAGTTTAIRTIFKIQYCFLTTIPSTMISRLVFYTKAIG